MRTILSNLLAAAAIAALSACGNSRPVPEDHLEAKAPSNEAAQRLATAWDGNWITLSGRVVGTGADRFHLDYGSGRVTVEMDDWDWFLEGRALFPGDEVTVTGRIDDDLYEQKKIEASSVYVKTLGSIFYANPQDEEDLAGANIYVPGTPGWVVATGVVSGIEGREFSIGASTGDLQVDTAGMSDNPLDAQGRFQVKAGDRVQVWGRLNMDPRERAEIMAEGMAALKADRTKSQPQGQAPGQAEGQAKGQPQGVPAS